LEVEENPGNGYFQFPKPNRMEEKLRFLEMRQKMLFAVLGLTLIANGWLIYRELSRAVEGDVIRTKGLVIEDATGHPRMVMGFPIPQEGRVRKDTLNGLVFLDNQGIDRIHVGQHGKLFLGGEYHDRLNEGWSFFFNDHKGEERSGYGFSDDDNSVGLGMDYGGEYGGEAIYLYAAPDIAFMTINADLQNNPGI
jgi:hypothetical protein